MSDYSMGHAIDAVNMAMRCDAQLNLLADITNEY
jgi:hypothetical protein